MENIIQNVNQFFGNGRTANMLLQNGCDLSILRTNAILQKDEWVELDKRVVKVATERLVVVQDLINAGLVLNLGGIGTTISEYQVESDMSGAAVSMEPDAGGNKDNLEYDTAGVPIPIIHKDFQLGIRQLEASRRMGSNIDLTTADTASRKVAEAMESLVVRGTSKKFGGKSIYGYITHPNRITGSAVGSWSDITNIYPTILNMLSAAAAMKKYGPFTLYVAGDVAMNLYSVYSDGSGQTVSQRILQIPEIKAVKISEQLPSGNLVLAQLTSDNIDLAVAQSIIPVEWAEKGGLVSQYKILAAMAPRIKADANGALGIVHYIGA